MCGASLKTSQRTSSCLKRDAFTLGGGHVDVQLEDDADLEREPNRNNGFTSFQQSRKKLLSAKSCTGVTEWLVLTTSTGLSKKRDQESRASTIDRLEIPGGVRAGDQGRERSRNLGRLQRSSGLISPYLWRTTRRVSVMRSRADRNRGKVSL